MQFIDFAQQATGCKAKRIWRFAGVFAVVKRQSECGSKTLGMRVNQQVNIDMS